MTILEVCTFQGHMEAQLLTNWQWLDDVTRSKCRCRSVEGSGSVAGDL